MTSKTAKRWIIAFLILCILPVAGGVARIVILLSGAETAENARFFDMPVPVVAHILTIIPWAVIGAFQFSPRLRRSGWHQRAGWILAPVGIAGAISGLYLSIFFERGPHVGGALTVIRVVVGIAIVVFLCLGVCAAVQRRFRQHRGWMIRAYALTIGTGLQPLTAIPYFAIASWQTTAGNTVTMAAGWLIAAAIAEWMLHERVAQSSGSTHSSGAVRSLS